MRNLKKILALVLALVMSMSLMATANAFTDDASITADYETATKVLAGMKVFQGYPDGSFAPKATITRQEVAAIMYRIASKDVTDLQDNLYVEGANFTDVKATDWSAGYIGYCANGGIVGGYGNGKFGPQDQVTGYQVLAMALRAIGYDKNGEFTGAEWQKNVATTAQSLGILKNVPGTVQLSQPATRELVAELVFQTMATAKMVNYTPAFGYQPTTKTLGQVQFGLTAAAGNDNWGRPTTVYTYTVGAKSTTITTKPIVTYTAATTECTIANDAKLTSDYTYITYTNGTVGSYKVELLDTVQKLGAQGRLIEVYKDRIVMIDTYLARVESVKAATYDASGHLATDSRIDLDVYTSNTAALDGGTELVLTNGKTNYTYAAGDMVLVWVNAANATKSEIKGTATTVTGAQTIIWYNAAQHTVNGTTYNDAVKFHLNQVNNETTNHTWYFDSYGNLIGATDIATQYDYAAVKNMWWSYDNTNGTGKAMATLVYMDGTENVVPVASIQAEGMEKALPTTYSILDLDIMNENGTYFYVAADAKTNDRYDDGEFNYDVIRGNLFRVQTLATGSVALVEVTTHVNAAVTKGVSTVQAPLYIDENTKFLVLSGNGTTTSPYTWTPITGYTNIGSYNAAEVDYVNQDTDVYAELVYIIGTNKAVNGSGLFYLTSNTIQWTLMADGVTVDDYILTGIVDGQPGSIKIDNDANAATLLARFVPGNGTSYVNKMFVVDYANGFVSAARFVGFGGYGNDYTVHSLTDTDVAAYANLSVMYIEGATGDTADANVNKVYFDGTNHWNIASANMVLGTWASDMSGYNTYLVYKTGTKTVVDAYVVAKPVSGTDGSAGALGGEFIVDANNTNFKVNATTKQICSLTPYSTTMGKMSADYAKVGYTLVMNGNVVAADNATTIAAALAGNNTIKLYNAADNTEIWTLILG